ncbi:MAG: 2'-5' RNA ligase family protein [Candidatus Nomurabacteria bacterium]|nr:MAG: 2'-5' RNA ligase family protein [Candidatus Nomurabacteria bacterium]HRV76384.1 2'-5' RNA ligase family protein [Candidatus Saccharimonadales bacterium]
MFDQDTYIVLELPEPIASTIRKVRAEQGDNFQASMPTEITIVGSSGVGCIAQDQDPDELFKTIDEIAASTPPITVSFDKVHRFPGTDIVVMKLKDETSVRSLHQRFVESGIKFQDSNFAYMPHCTLRSKSPLADQEMEELSKLKIEGDFALHTLSVFTMPPPGKLIYTAKL